MKKKQKKVSIGIKILVVSCSFFANFWFAANARAGYWGEPTAASMMLFNLQQIAENIKGVTLSIAKNAAIQAINQQVLGMVNGTWGQGSLIIEDWRGFIYTQSSQKAQDVVLNSFFPAMFGGKGSGGNYIAASEGVLLAQGVSNSINTIKNYPEYLSTIGKNTLQGLAVNTTPRYTLDQQCPDPQAGLARGDYRCFSSIMEIQNNPRGIPILTEQKYLAEKMMNERIAATQAGITGYKPQTNAQGLVVTPPETVANVIASTLALPGQALAAAQHPTELLTGLIQMYVNSLVQKTLSKVGLGSTTASSYQNLNMQMNQNGQMLMQNNVGALFNNGNASGVGTNIIGPMNLGNFGTSSTPNLDNSNSGPNWRYLN
ncbi:MAG: hypothetical protein IPL87_00755 [Candidatus Moraniibacteriota bacterium]|nr:MAG: hypothetical protein IPL87_00755 [Candidatus Moranbacteria bacterium]